MINARVPTERSRHVDIRYFAIQDWKGSGDIVMKFIPGVINPSDDLTKPLGWVLHERHARRIMGHCYLVSVSFHEFVCYVEDPHRVYYLIFG